MREYVTEALVLEKRPAGEADCTLVFYTEHFGKLTARARSARKITSKLSAHLEPGNIARVRLVEKKMMHVADALKIRRTDISLLDLHFFSRLTAPEQPDAALWGMLRFGVVWREALSHLGWDARFASCRVCGGAPQAFYITTHEFYCTGCAASSDMGANEVVYIA